MSIPDSSTGTIPGERIVYQFKPIDSATFAQSDFRPSWLVKRLLVRNQPCIVGGQKKMLKTSLVLDLAISLGSQTPFLGEFRVDAAARTAVISGESGEFTLQETASRICAAKRIDLKNVNCVWDFKLPQLSNYADLKELRDGLETYEVEVAIIDPLYLCLLAGQVNADSANLYSMGPLFLAATTACRDVGCTPIFIHHSRMHAGTIGKPPELEDLAYAGVQEFARQWLLVSRRESTSRAAVTTSCGWSPAGRSDMAAAGQ
jgi:AAA domain